MEYLGFGFWRIYAEDQATPLGVVWLRFRAIKKLDKYAKTLG